jgi:PEP-CTERM motif
MFKKYSLAVLLSVAITYGLFAPAHSAVIDTTGVVGAIFVPFGDPHTATYGQTFVPSGADTFLDSFSLYLRTRQTGAGTLDLRGYIGDWNGSRPNNILYESATQTMNALGEQQEFAFDPDIVLTSGQTYVAFLSISNLPDQAESTFGMPSPGLGSDLIPGNFVFLSNGQNFGLLTTQNWSNLGDNSSDVWFRASLTSISASIPEPGALALIGVGLAALAYRRRRHNTV